MSRSEREQERDYAIVRLQQIVGRRSTIYTLTTYTRSQTDYVRTFTVSHGEIVELTYFAARASGRRLVPGKGVALRGGGYSKGLEAADDVYRAVFGRALDQSRWREL